MHSPDAQAFPRSGQLSTKSRSEYRIQTVVRFVDTFLDVPTATRGQVLAAVRRFRRCALESSALVRKAFTQGKNGPERDGPVVCVAYRGNGRYSETFIRAHIERLPARVVELSGRGRFQESSLQRFLLKNRVDAVLAEYGPTGVAVMEACQKMGVPLIVHFHGYDAYSRATLERKGRSYPTLFERSAALVVVSKDMERRLLTLGAPREKLHYNPCGVDISLFRGAPSVDVPPVFLAVGRFVGKKAPQSTLAAFSKVRRAHPEAKLVMFGEGPLLETCQQLAGDLGISDHVHFLGPRPHHAVAAAMQRACAFVQHSVRASDGDSEGTPVAVLEAGAAGLPVVATRHGGIPDVVIDGHTGLLVDEGDIDGMAASMQRLLEDPEMAKRLGTAARERVVSKYSLDRSIANLWSIIEAAMHKHR